jgi:hypothetical protein
MRSANIKGATGNACGSASMFRQTLSHSNFSIGLNLKYFVFRFSPLPLHGLCVACKLSLHHDLHLPDFVVGILLSCICSHVCCCDVFSCFRDNLDNFVIAIGCCLLHLVEGSGKFLLCLTCSLVL